MVRGREREFQPGWLLQITVDYLKLVIKYSITMIKFNLLNLFALLYFFLIKIYTDEQNIT